MNPEQEPFSLYLKERGWGYGQQDRLDMLRVNDLAFLIRMIYKSNVLGPAAYSDDLHIDTFENINLTGCNMGTVPILLDPHADAIISLNLLRNLMLEIPLDFIQACMSLHDHELHLTNMVTEKEPQSVWHCHMLHRFDLSCNHIVNLDDAGLDKIPSYGL
ncbi:uncharacterized protein LAESUDRAFT_765420 [Laetiporus sulphureus 93-53]|uniref:Uncharacterized protein n=1 Tax=Laetiporus sulphureus 93-53 TaxID=1314785 RepID=A0A165ARY9_9APHY|nr:uncharacterized protein LAESUDRAFT_765420 [Laetiporus sulphureus 93-53]KZS99543.1 hypothetical protein LAESUDRAFT_765420 [Laetiporus sulphureus 93-53]